MRLLQRLVLPVPRVQLPGHKVIRRQRGGSESQSHVFESLFRQQQRGVGNEALTIVVITPKQYEGTQPDGSPGFDDLWASHAQFWRMTHGPGLYHGRCFLCGCIDVRQCARCSPVNALISTGLAFRTRLSHC